MSDSYEMPNERPSSTASVVRQENEDKPSSKRMIIVRYVCYGVFGLSFLAASLVFGYAISYWSHQDNNNSNSNNELSPNNTTNIYSWSDEEFQNRYRLFRSYAGNWSDEVVLFQSNTPQAQALDWLVYQDQTVSHIIIKDELKLQTKQYATFLNTLATRYAILILYFSTGGGTTGSASLTNDPTKATCDWPFVTCNTTTDNDDEVMIMVAIEVHDVLIGPLPEELSLLSTLTSLDLSRTELKGTIPGGIFASLTNLEFLDLSSNKLAGSIPSELGLLSQLTRLDVRQNYLQGPLPITLQNLTQLQVVYFSSNQQLSTSASLFDDFISHWSQLQIFHCHQTQFSGEIKKLPTTLQELDISSSPITGSLANLPLMLQLTHLTVANNNLHGALPLFTHVPNMEVLTLQANAFTGTIASDIGTLSNLKQFQVGLTQVHGTIPSEIGQCTKLQSLHLTRNSLTGTIPSEIGNLVILRTMAVDKNRGLQGPVPMSMCQALQTTRLFFIRDCNLQCECCSEMCIN